MLGGAMSPTSAGTSIIEKNLDRITIGFAVAFGVSLLLLMIVYPHGI
jgi:preprotein translocase subunit SecG